MKKKAILISCFDWYEKRLEPIRETLLAQNFDVMIVLCDFDHISKEYFAKKKSHCVYISVPKYNKNLSVNRLYSHVVFARKVYGILMDIKPDFVYALLPPNSIAECCVRYKKKTKVKLVFDIIDLWPESIPIGVLQNTPPFLVWKNLRNRNLKYADYIFTECALYQDELKNVLCEKYSTLYLFKNQTECEKRSIDIESCKEHNNKTISLGYVGSMNYIVDISSIVDVVKFFQDNGMEVDLHLIGDGEGRKHLLEELYKIKCKTNYYGKIFDEQEKIKILSKCDFGLNLMVDTVKVGLTIKSIDYFSYGLPIINNIKGDTWKIVEDYEIGYNITNCINVKEILKYKNPMTKNKVLQVYNELFTRKAFINNFNQAMEFK